MLNVTVVKIGIAKHISIKIMNASHVPEMKMNELPHNLFGIEPLLPAYGKRFTTTEETQQHFDANRDFRTVGGQYINKNQLVPILKNLKRDSIAVRINRDWQVFVKIEVEDE